MTAEGLPMNRKLLLLSCVLAALLLVPLGCQPVLLRTGFETDPAAAGWQGDRSSPGDRREFEGRWADTGARSGRHCMEIRRGLWQSPPIPAGALQYVRVRFAVKADKGAFRVMRFFDAAGREIVADDHDSVNPSPGWTVREFCTHVREGTAVLRVAFVSNGSPVFIDDVTVTAADAAEVLRFADRVYRTVPPVNCAVEADRWKHLSGTMERLRGGKELRLLLLGDSIANDLSNSQFHLLIQRMYPRSRVTLLRSILGNTGCPVYQHRVKEFVTDKDPDLVVIAGISHGGDAAAIRSVIAQARRQMSKPAEFLVTTGAVIQPGMNSGWKQKGMDSAPPEAVQRALDAEAKFHAELVQARDEDRFATLDLRTMWEEYLKTSSRPRSWYQRDYIHANARGKQVLGRIVADFFQPDARK